MALSMEARPVQIRHNAMRPFSLPIWNMATVCWWSAKL